MGIEISGKIFPSKKRKVELKPLPADLVELVGLRKNLRERIVHLESEITYKDKRTVLDIGKLDSLSEENLQIAKGIYDLCLKYGEDSRRFLSEEETGKILAESNDS